VSKTPDLRFLFSIILAVAFCLSRGFGETVAQVRGVYPLGMSATNSGVTPESGFSYSNMFLFYSRNRLKDPNGKVIATGYNSVTMDMNSFIWVSKREILGGAKFSMSATLPIANNSLTSDASGPVSGGSGFADSYYQPFILGWQKQRVAIRAVYGFLAPTGRFEAGRNDNVGSAYWTHAFSSGQTLYLTENKRTSVSTFQMYEIHTHQKGTSIHPGQTMNLDYSVMHSISPGNEWTVQIGVAGYGQWQTTDKTGPTIKPEQAKAHYRVNALGFASNVSFPNRKISLGIKYFKEFANRSTLQGYSIQGSGSIRF
jgi:hypothetical protein